MHVADKLDCEYILEILNKIYVMMENLEEDFSINEKIFIFSVYDKLDYLFSKYKKRLEEPCEYPE